mmetsp:Transcript_28653/g.75000  ORF Transcript_28653/g.75000 Transcript_28653/m.75000 type:complete len:236 (+) Transcript_28653:1340-2047(+)
MFFIPEALEYLVAETHRLNVQHDLFTQVVVDPENLILGKQLGSASVQLCKTGTVSTKGLLENETSPSTTWSLSAGVDALDHVAKNLGRNGKEKQSVSLTTALELEEVLVQSLVRVGRIVRSRKERALLEELLLLASLDVDALLRQEVVERDRRASVAHHVRVLWHQRRARASEHKLVHSRIQLLLCEIPRRTEDHDRHRRDHVHFMGVVLHVAHARAPFGNLLVPQAEACLRSLL